MRNRLRVTKMEREARNRKKTGEERRGGGGEGKGGGEFPEALSKIRGQLRRKMV